MQHVLNTALSKYILALILLHSWSGSFIWEWSFFFVSYFWSTAKKNPKTFFVSIFSPYPFLSLCLPATVPFSSCVRSVRAAILTAETDRERHVKLPGSMGTLLDFGTGHPSVSFFTPSLALTGHGYGRLWRMTNLASIMNETPPTECQKDAGGAGSVSVAALKITWWMVCLHVIPGLCQLL